MLEIGRNSKGAPGPTTTSGGILAASRIEEDMATVGWDPVIHFLCGGVSWIESAEDCVRRNLIPDLESHAPTKWELSAKRFRIGRRGESGLRCSHTGFAQTGVRGSRF